MKQEHSLTLHHAIDILDHLSDVSGLQSLSDIAAAAGITPPAAHRLLATLKARGMVLQDPRTRQYALGLGLLAYANRITASAPFASVIEPYLVQLRDLSGETTTFHVPRGTVRVCVLECESRQEIRRTVGVGRQVPLYAGASGRAILAFQPMTEQDKLISSLDAEEQKTVRARLEETRRLGYAMSFEESTANVAALAAPLFDRGRDSVLGSVSISGPVFRWHRETMRPFAEKLLEIIHKIEQAVSD